MILSGSFTVFGIMLTEIPTAPDFKFAVDSPLITSVSDTCPHFFRYPSTNLHVLALALGIFPEICISAPNAPASIID